MLVNKPLQLAHLLRESKRKINWLNGSRGPWNTMVFVKMLSIFIEEVWTQLMQYCNTLYSEVFDPLQCHQQKTVQALSQICAKFSFSSLPTWAQMIKGSGYLWKGFESLTKGCNTKLATGCATRCVKMLPNEPLRIQVQHLDRWSTFHMLLRSTLVIYLLR